MRHAAPLLYTLGVFALLGCGQSTPNIATPAPQSLDVQTAGIASEHLAGQWELTIDPVTLTGHLAFDAKRSGMSRPPQTRNYDLDLTNLVTENALQILRVGRDSVGDIVVTYRHRHPFPAPDLARQTLGTNRADLSYTGRLLVLADQQVTSFFEGTVTLDPSLVRHADGFLNTGDLLATQGLAVNTFPYMLLVNEADDNREQASNQGLSTGNYDAPDGGWHRENLGASGDQWTGYDYLHAGQSTIGTVTLNHERLTAGPVAIRLALFVKYSDPKGSTALSSRMPGEPADPLAFAYRLPYAALDCSQLTIASTASIGVDAGSKRVLNVALRDWDARARVATQPDLSLETDVALIQPGAEGSPLVQIDASGLMSAPLVLSESASGSGTADDPIGYQGTLQNETGMVALGIHWALVRAIDPEDSDPLANDYRFGIDPVTLSVDAARALSVRTYQPIAIEVRPVAPSATFAHRWGGLSTFNEILGLTVDQEGNAYVGGYIAKNGNPGTPSDFDPTAAEDLQVVIGSTDSFLAKIAPDGSYMWGHRWGNDAVNGVQNEEVTALMYEPGTDSLMVAGRFQGSLDLDPGPGEFIRTATGFQNFHTYLSRFTLDGTFITAGTFGSTPDWQWTMPNALASDGAGHVYVAGTFEGIVDFDPGPGTAIRDARDFRDAWVAEFSPDIALDNVWTWGGEFNEEANGLAVTPNGLLICGSFREGDFDPGAGVQQRNSVGIFSDDAYLLKLSRNGEFQWVQTWGNPTDYRDMTAIGLATDSLGRFGITGSFVGADADFDPGAGTVSRSAAYRDDGYLLVLNGVGEFAWVRTWDGPLGDVDGGVELAVDGDDAWIIAGRATPGDGDASYLSFNTAGTMQWNRNLATPEFGSGQSVVVAPDGYLYVTGYSEGPTDMDPGDQEDVNTVGAVPLMHLLRLNPYGLLDP